MGKKILFDSACCTVHCIPGTMAASMATAQCCKPLEVLPCANLCSSACTLRERHACRVPGTTRVLVVTERHVTVIASVADLVADEESRGLSNFQAAQRPNPFAT